MKFIFALLFFCALNSFGQKFADKNYYLIDSLDLSTLSPVDSVMIINSLKTYHATNNDTSKLKIIDGIVESCWDVEVWPKYNNWMYSQAQQKLENEAVLSKQELRFYRSALSSALNNKGYLADSQNKSDVAISFYNEALQIDIQIGDKKGVGQILNNIAGLKSKQGKVRESLNYGLTALQLREQIKDSAGMAQSYNNIGSTYDDIGAKDSLSKAYVYKSYQIRKAIGDEMGVGICLSNIAGHEIGMGQIDSAFTHYRQALKIFLDNSNLYGAAYVYNNLGDYYRRVSEYDSSKFYLYKSLEIRRAIGDKYGTGTALKDLSFLHLKEYKSKGGVNPAELAKIQSEAEEGLRLGNQIGYPMLIKNSSEILVWIYTEQNNAKLAVEMYELAVKMKDSLNGIESQKAVIEEQTKFEYEKQKAIDDVVRDKEVALEKEQKARQRVVIIIVSIGSVLLAILLGFIVNRLRLTKKQNREIERQKEQIDNQHKALEETHQEITDSINYAKRIQTALLPTNDLISASFSSAFVLYLPKDVVAGDFYWMHSIGEKSLIAAADCTGHGVPGALVSVVCNNCLNRSVKEFGLNTPAEILDKTRALVIEEFEKSDEEVKDGMDIAMISIHAHKLQFAGANNPLWILRNGELIEIKGDKQPIGKHVEMKPFTNHEFDLQSNDILYIFSDGFSDQFGGDKGKKLKSSNLKKLLIEHSDKSLDQQKEVLKAEFYDWMGDFAQLDDVCLIGIRVQ